MKVTGVVKRSGFPRSLDHHQPSWWRSLLPTSLLALVLLVMSSAVRANAAIGAAVPPLALSALIGCLGAYALLGVVWLLWAPFAAWGWQVWRERRHTGRQGRSARRGSQVAEARSR